MILTPHIGGSTEEAQERIGEEVARKLIDYSDTGSTMGAVNFPQAQLPARPLGTRFIQVQRNAPGMLGKLNDVLARHAVNIAAQYLRDAQRNRLCRDGRRRLRSRQPARAGGNPRVGRNHPARACFMRSVCNTQARASVALERRFDAARARAINSEHRCAGIGSYA